MKLTFFAQSLSNRGADHYVLRGTVVPAKDETRQEEVAGIIGDVARNGRSVYESGKARAKVNRWDFLLEVVPTERDSAGRQGPMVCCGQMPHPPTDAWGTGVQACMREFALSIGRTFDPEADNDMSAALAAVVGAERVRRALLWRIENIKLRCEETGPKVASRLGRWLGTFRPRHGANSRQDGLQKEYQVARIVLVVSRLTDRQLQAERHPLLKNPDIIVVAVPHPGDDPLVTQLDAEGKLTPGTILLQSPFNPTVYVPADEANDAFAVQKNLMFCELCSLLGAREVCVQQIHISTGSGRLTLSARGEVLNGTVAASAEVEAKQYGRMARRLAIRDEHKGSAPRIAAAERLLADNRLQGDIPMNALLRLVQSSNRLISREVQVNLTQESKATLRTAATLDVPAYAKLNANLDNLVDKATDYELTYRIVFGPPGHLSLWDWLRGLPHGLDKNSPDLSSSLSPSGCVEASNSRAGRRD